MEFISFIRLFMAVSLILIYMIHKLLLDAMQASPMNANPLHEGMDFRHLGFEDQLQFIDADEFVTDTDLFGRQLGYDSLSASYLSMSVLFFELNEHHLKMTKCLEAGNYSVMRTFSAVNVGDVVLKVKGFKIGTSPSALQVMKKKFFTSSDLNPFYSPANEATAPSGPAFDNKETNDCHGYGFTIIDCEPFDLEPNRVHKIRIVFNPDFTLAKTIVEMSILTDNDEEFKYALVASIPRNLLAKCNQSLPRPEWESNMHLVLVLGVAFMILCSVLSACREANLYLKSTLKAHSDSNVSRTSQANQNGSIKKNGHQQQQQQQPKKSIKRKVEEIRKSSSTSNSEKVPSYNNKSIGSNSTDKKVSSPCVPIFQNLTNVIASPPPPLPAFDCDFDVLEFKKLKNKKSSKKSNSLSGSITSNDDIGASNALLSQANGLPAVQNNAKSNPKSNNKSNGPKLVSSNSLNSSDFVASQTQSRHQQLSAQQNNVRGNGSLSVNPLPSDHDNHLSGEEFEGTDQPFAMPIRPPNSSSSSSSTTSSSSSPLAAFSTPSASSSASSSPPLPASEYGEYSLLGPGVTFELPCLRVRSAQSYTLRDRLK